MKIISAIVLFIFCLSCGNNPAPEIKVDSGKGIDASLNKNDTGFVPYRVNQDVEPLRDSSAIDSHLNFIDAKGKKQGHWIVYGKMQKNSDYGPLAKVEEGNYVDDAKDGLWTTYDPDGSVKKTISIRNRNH